MQIDWVTIVAQIVNFLILVWLLHRVLYRPLTRAIEARGQEVSRRLAEAEEARRAAEAAEEAHQAAIRALEADREATMQVARDDAGRLRHELNQMVHTEIAEHREAWQRQLDDEKAAFLDRLRRRAGEAFVTLARRVLAEMADRELVDQIASVFARRLEGMDAAERERLQKAVGPDETPEILSSFPLSERTRDLVGAAVSELLGDGQPALRFRHEAGIDCGIVLVLGSRHVGWTIGEHLDALEQEVAELLQPAQAKAVSE